MSAQACETASWFPVLSMTEPSMPVDSNRKQDLHGSSHRSGSPSELSSKAPSENSMEAGPASALC